MIRDIPGTFRTGRIQNFLGSSPYNVADFSTTSGGVNGGWTRGAMLLDAIDFQQVHSGHIHAFSIVGQMLLAVTTNLNNPDPPLSGKLGRVYGGIQTQGTQTSGPAGGTLPTNATFQPLPEGPYTGVLWDPATDSLPPLIFDNVPIPDGQAFHQLSLSVALSQIIPIYSGGSFLIGMWIEPSLLSPNQSGLGCVAMTILNAKYVVTIDQDPITNV